ncbi:uncharacterized protein FFFS_15891 [Fusarium fujikuroi]|nr:uncharacterized protein FFFS_15891 [Fusarium fujikuroi]
MPPVPSGRIAFRPLAHSLQLQRDYENSWRFADLSDRDCRSELVSDLFDKVDEHLVPSKIGDTAYARSLPVLII